MTVSIQQRVDEAVRAVKAAWLAAAEQSHEQSHELPEVIITTGSGLGSIVRQLEPVLFEMSYDDIPHLPASRVVGHAGRLVVGYYGGSAGKKVMVLDGRVHGYEGHDPLTQVLPLLIANQLCEGAKLALFTNAAGAINESYQVGELMLIKDHINFLGQTLLVFNEESNFGGKNLDMTYAYTPKYRELLKEIAATECTLHEGVYVATKGAMFETPAEINAFRIWGADAVGMSTVHEVAAASRLGIDTVAVSVLSNMAAGIEAKKLSHRDVLDNTAEAADNLAKLIGRLLLKVG